MFTNRNSFNIDNIEEFNIGNIEEITSNNQYNKTNLVNQNNKLEINKFDGRDFSEFEKLLKGEKLLKNNPNKLKLVKRPLIIKTGSGQFLVFESKK